MSTVRESHRATIRDDRERLHDERRHDANARAPFEEPTHETRSLSTLLRELRDEAMTLVEKEFQLAKAEISEKVDKAENALATSVGGVALMISGIFTLCLSVAAGLYVAMIALDVTPAIALWAAPLIVGLVVAIIGYAMTRRARVVTRADHWRPERTERSVRETKDWAERKF